MTTFGFALYPMFGYKSNDEIFLVLIFDFDMIIPEVEIDWIDLTLQKERGPNGVEIRTGREQKEV